MTYLSDTFTLRERFQRSTRIDNAGKDELDGFILHETGKQIIKHFLHEVSGGTQRAFTWTGPYGSGKSTLALYLSQLLASSDLELNKNNKLGKVLIRHFREAEGGVHKPWLVLRITAQKEPLTDTILRVIRSATKEYFSDPIHKEITDALDLVKSEADFVKNLNHLSEKAKNSGGGGLLLIIDEMGKAVEYVSRRDRDLYFFQELAEQFSRANSRSVVLGVLHQSFEEYANRSDLAQRKEWSKIQGRFEDTPFSVNIEESLELISNAIKGRRPSNRVERESQVKEILGSLNSPRFSNKTNLVKTLANCFPLNPVAALILPSISRQKFGQNERSVFSFLFSGESGGFRDYLETTTVTDQFESYFSDRLWDYLEFNLQQVILASSLGHRWSEASEAITRTEERGGALHLKVIKTIALIDLFGRPFSLVASENFVSFGVACSTKEFNEVIRDLNEWKVIALRKHLGAWVITSGSDIDIDGEVEKALIQLGYDLRTVLDVVPSQKPVIAKRHYFETGTLRNFPIKIMLLEDLNDFDGKEFPSASDGVFVLLLSNKEKNYEDLEKVSEKIAKNFVLPVILGWSDEAPKFIDLCFEFAALCRVEDRVAEIQTDPVARREIRAKQSLLLQELATSIKYNVNNARWIMNGQSLNEEPVSLSKLASRVSDRIYIDAPKLKNELINRSIPSGASNAARRKLLYLMISNPELENLGIEKYPPEKGMYLSILKRTGLHGLDSSRDAWEFRGENPEHLPEDFEKIWETTYNCLLKSSGSGDPVLLTKIYELWSLPPFGLKRGIFPILVLAFIMARKRDIAIYVDGVFEYRFDELLAENILLEPEKVGIKLVEMKGIRKETLKALLKFTRDLLDNARGETPLSAAQSLAQFAHSLHPWVKRTELLPGEVKKIRNILLRANDPEKLLFQDLPNAFQFDSKLGEKDSSILIEKLEEVHSILHNRYNELLKELKLNFCEAFSLPTKGDEGIKRLAKRAQKVTQKTGDFNLDAIINRLQDNLEDGDKFERLVSLVSGVSVKDWTDNDYLKSRREIQELALKFESVERFFSVGKIGDDTGDIKTFSIFVNGSDKLKQYHKPLHLTRKEEKVVRDGVQRVNTLISDLALAPNEATALLLEALESRLKETPLTVKEENDG